MNRNLKIVILSLIISNINIQSFANPIEITDENINLQNYVTIEEKDVAILFETSSGKEYRYGSLQVDIPENTQEITIYKMLSQEKEGIKVTPLFKSNISKSSNFLTQENEIKFTKEVKDLVEEITKNSKTEEEKVNAVFNYIKNFKYNSNLVDTTGYFYRVDVNQIIQSKEGVCFDYSILFASMLRYLNIETKVVKGYVGISKSYHAWNEVKLNNKWVQYDITTRQKEINNPSSYVKKFEY